MPKKRQGELVTCAYFCWVLSKRRNIYQADGRTNKVNAGRHSLGTSDREEALRLLERLDTVQAVELGLADKSILNHGASTALPLEEGWERYLTYVKRPPIRGGTRPATPKRYRAVRRKFVPFAQQRGVHTWQGVNPRLLDAYLAKLQTKGFSEYTQYLELVVICQACKWFVSEGLLPAESRFKYRLKKPRAEQGYCWTNEEVNAILDHCAADPKLHWLRNVLVALCYTGLRISELATLSWSNVDLPGGLLKLEARNTKTGRPRTLPIHRHLRSVLDGLPRANDGYVFRGASGRRLNAGGVRTALVEKVIEPLKGRFPGLGDGKSFKDGRLHAFRHLFCSICHRSGVPELVVKNWLGHRDSQMVHTYFHANSAVEREMMNGIDFLA